MTYQESLDFLYQALPMFQRVGAPAFKKDLTNTIKLCERLGNPQQTFKSIHIAGTNGKGSSAHALASILQEAGYKTGLYTSPHLKSFRERIKINGQEIPEEEVCAFVEEQRDFLLDLKPSFFEMTVAMAFSYFAREKVDIAVIETGMGGRFDSTNVLKPLLSLITNISLDHVQFLGDTLEKIASEKAGIIKEGVPVIIGQTQEVTTAVFQQAAREKKAPLFFADQSFKILPKGWKETADTDTLSLYEITEIDGSNWEVGMDLLGNYQAKNLPGILLAVARLNEMGFKIASEDLVNGLARIRKNTGLKGRWQLLGKDPLIICDTGHNEDGIKLIIEQLNRLPHRDMYLVLGMVQDKDHGRILDLLPKKAQYIFCQADQPRSLPAEALKEKAALHGLRGISITDVNAAIAYAKKNARTDDLIFIGGSTFVVAEIKEL
ncbi:bifunctional folylpolyglutamate synthase/dihydrofolate synthase [Cyclobacterium jeungdonense]|uniref:Dihydrofolate synthase/folylpolyglutamate synthase n=1 Tax=Cyclobacterium jeungdonense TaxID=708087 RepID=A0ABT8CBN4_9BACT|nr:folylpolyglutamate synthase/dihydrofolate synthase family protein [Cyclobacterium jeungdonense]MDN3690199.1 folylpolyglutamate synthase/dihydrofolate synthase family protein [Cyclobacterium jeungdonense]